MVRTKFAKKSDVAAVPLELRSKTELLELLDKTNKCLQVWAPRAKSNIADVPLTEESLQNAELIATPPVSWDGSEGAEEVEIIESCGMFIAAYEVPAITPEPRKSNQHGLVFDGPKKKYWKARARFELGLFRFTSGGWNLLVLCRGLALVCIMSD